MSVDNAIEFHKQGAKFRLIISDVSTPADPRMTVIKCSFMHLMAGSTVPPETVRNSLRNPLITGC